MKRRSVLSASGVRRGALACCLLLIAQMVGAALASAGTLQDFKYPSRALGHEASAQVYVPDGTAPPGGWPTLYLLHGLNGRGTDWETLGGIRARLDKMIAEHAIKPLLVVMPTAENSWYVDSAEVRGPGNYASAIGADLPDAIEAAYPVGKDRAHRAIAGLSMGGFGALRLALSQPDRYVAVAALSPAIWQNMPQDVIGKSAAELDALRTASYFRRPDPDTVTIGIDLPPPGDHFGGAFGTPFDPKRFNAENVFTLLKKAVEAKATLPSVYLTVGDDDSHLLWRGAIAFFETMQMDRQLIDFRVTDGDHNWQCWRQSLGDAIQFVDAALVKANPARSASR